MKIVITEDVNVDDLEVNIVCQRADKLVLDLIARLRTMDGKVTALQDGRTRILKVQEIFYIESVDKRTFLYTQDEVLESPLRLYELEDRLADLDFIRVSKACIINFQKLAALKPDINGRIIAIMENDEAVIVSRQYTKVVKQKLGLL